jgi:2-keto-4-pentenoate hydratase
MFNAQDDSRIQQGLEKQLRLRRDRLDAGEKPIGWKVGFGAPAAMERLAIDGPLVGFLTDRSILDSGKTAVISNWSQGFAEPEIAVYLGSDLTAGSDRASARAAIASIGPAIELADINIPPDNVEAILAGNVYHRHVVFGRADTSRAGCVLDGLVGRVYHNESQIAEVTDSQSATGDLIDIVRHVADVLAAFGERLQAGEIIITGSIVPPISIAPQDRFRFALEPVDTISVGVV